MSTLSELARQLSESFERRARDNGEKFYTLRDGSPQWMTDAVHAAHGDMLPDDWRYEAIALAADTLAQAEDDDLDDLGHEWADGAVDTYNADRLRWVASNLNRPYYVDDAREEGLIEPGADLLTQLGVGQYQELREVWSLLVEHLTEMAEEYDIDDRGVIELLTPEAIERTPGAATCGTCGRSWDDDHSTGVTPTPAGRCPFEDDHDEDGDE